jgi:uncharacterized membrane protein
MADTLAAGLSGTAPLPTVRRIELADIGESLRRGYADFRLAPTHLVILGLVYPVVGLVLARMASGAHALPLLYPLVAGFALLGPFGAVGLYEMSRRREAGEPISLASALDILRSPRIGAVLLLGVMLAGWFVAWLVAARLIYDAILPAASPETIGDFLAPILSTGAGLRLIVVGTLVGAGFAVVVLALGAVSFPMLVDRDVSPGQAVATSLRAALANPVPMAAWGAIVVAGMAIGAASLLVGMAVVMPVLGHATWHLYRRLVV